MLSFPPPNLSSVTSPSVMVPDATNQRFTYSLFLGIEKDLLLFNVLTFSVVELWGGNVGMAIALTFVADTLITWARGEYGARNLSRKTCVDERFLV